MIKRLLLLLLFTVVPAFATTTQITGTLVDGSGNPVTGTGCFKLPVNAVDTSTNKALSPRQFCYPITNGTFPAFASVVPNDVISPAETYYQFLVRNQAGALVFAANYVIPTGAGTFNIGLAIPTSVLTNNISYASPVLAGSNINFTGNNTFAGTTGLNGGGSQQGVWTAGPSYGISTVSESGNVVTVNTSTPCSAITAANMSIVVTGVGVGGYNNGPGGLIGFSTTAACVASSFTYFNPTSGLGASSGGSVIVSPIFSQGLTHFGPETVTGQLTFSNHNSVYWAGPGAVPTIDQAITACGTNPCIVEISPTYSGADSASCVTNSTGYTTYQGPNNITVHDQRSLNGNNTITTACIYNVIYGGRVAGATNRMGVSYYAHNSPDSMAGSNGWVWVDGTLPSNSGAMVGSIGFAFTHDTLTIGSSSSEIDGSDSEAYHNATTVDKDLQYIAGGTAQSGISRSGATGNVLTSTAHSSKACANTSSTAKIVNCYGYDALRPSLGILNYGIHNWGSELQESGQSFDVVDAGFNITAASSSGFTDTITISGGPCTFPTGSIVRITGVGTTVLGYNGAWTVLTPGCNGGSSFTFTNTATGLGTLGAGGIAAGLHQALSFNKLINSSVVFQPLSDTIGWTFQTNDLVARAKVTKSGLFGAGTVGATSAGGAFLGGIGNEFAGLYMQETGAPSGNAGDTVCGGNSTTHTLQCSYNNGTVGSVPLIGPTLAFGNVPSTWNWAQTTDSQDAITFGETSAATGGTLTSLLANQAEVNINTASGSTATPLEVVQAGITATTGPPLAQFESTWNNGSLVGQGIVENVTNTSSAASSLLLNLRIGNVTQFSVDKGGYTTTSITSMSTGNQIISGSDYTNSTTTPSTIFSWTLPATAAAKTYIYSCDLTWESTAATLTFLTLGVNISAAPTQITSAAAIQNTIAGNDAVGYISNTTTGHQNVTVGSAAGVTSTNYWARIWGTIEGAPTAGSTFIIDGQAGSNVTSTVNIRRGSGCLLTASN